MRWLVSALLLSTALGETSSAARRDFPYTATIEVESAEVRSGAGRNYYVTGQVHRGEQVTVRRHDPGGWYMISPQLQLDPQLTRREAFATARRGDLE